MAFKGTELRDDCHFIALFSSTLEERVYYKEHGEETEYPGDHNNAVGDGRATAG